MKITTDDLKQIIKEELKEGYLSGTAEETILEMRKHVERLRELLLEAEKRGADRRYAQQTENLKQAYRQFKMAYANLEGDVTSYISG